MKLRTNEEVKFHRLTKGYVASELYGQHTYDTALPQQVANELERHMEGATSLCVMGYGKAGAFGQLLPLTCDMADLLLSLSSDKLATLMNWREFGLELDSRHRWEIV